MENSLRNVCLENQKLHGRKVKGKETVSLCLINQGRQDEEIRGSVLTALTLEI
jgi:hypothetical protein